MLYLVEFTTVFALTSGESSQMLCITWIHNTNNYLELWWNIWTAIACICSDLYTVLESVFLPLISLNVLSNMSDLWDLVKDAVLALTLFFFFLW